MILNIWKLSNNAFEQVAIIDYATSVIWVEPFQGYRQVRAICEGNAGTCFYLQG